MNHLSYSKMHLIQLVLSAMSILILQSDGFLDHQKTIPLQFENTTEIKHLHFMKSYVFLFYEDPHIVIAERNTIVIINTTSLASASQHILLRWNSLDPNLCITSAFRVHINREYMPRQAQPGTVRLVCGHTGLNRTELLEDDRLMFDGMLCSYWYHPVQAIFKPWTRVHAGSVLWFALLTNTLDSKLLFATKLLLSKQTLVTVDARTNIGVVVGYLQRVVNEKRELLSPKPWFSRFELDRPVNHATQIIATHQTSWIYKDTETDQSGWLSNAESNLWFSDQVQFHQLAAINELYFYGVFTEEDILTISDPTDNLGTRPPRMITQVARVCQRDPGQGKAGQFLTTNGVFTTFRKTRLRCQTTAGRQTSTKLRSISRLQPLELTRAMAVSEFVTTDNRKDHVFYAMMTTSDSVTGVYGLCAFRLSDVDLALNYDRLFTWQSADVPSESWLERFLRNITPFSHPSEGDGSTLRQTTYGKSVGENIRVISQTPMTQAITNASKTCPSKTLPEYFARFATQHPHVASSVLAFTPNSADSRSTEALVYFRLPTRIEHAVEIGNPTSLVVDWSRKSTDVDKIFIGTDTGKILSVQTGIPLLQLSKNDRNLESLRMEMTSTPKTKRKLSSWKSEPAVIELFELNITSNAHRSIYRLIDIRRENHSCVSGNECKNGEFRFMVLAEDDLYVLRPNQISFQPIEWGRFYVQPNVHASWMSASTKTLENEDNRRVNTNFPGELHQIPQTGYDMDGINRVLGNTTILIILCLVIICVPAGFILGFLLGRQSRGVHKPHRKVLNVTDLTRLSAMRSVSGYENFKHIDRKWNPEVMLNHAHTKEDRQSVLNGWAASTIKTGELISIQNQHKSGIERVLLTERIPHKAHNVTEVVINTLHPSSDELTKCTDPILLWKFSENNNSQSHSQLTADSLSFAHKSFPSSQTDDEFLDV